MQHDLVKACFLSIALCVSINVQTATASDSIFTANAQRHSSNLDTKTELALDAILSGDWPNAAHHAQQLVDSFPDYALAQLILAEAHNVAALSDPLITRLPNYSTEIIELLLEARARVQHKTVTKDNFADNSTQLPAELIQAGSHIDHVVFVDLDSSHLYLFDTTSPSPQLIKKHYISSGKAGFGKLIEGDFKTPLGVYRIHGFRSDDSLPSLYGSGALMLNFPNALDRSLGRTGSGIWLHGNPRSDRSRSPRSSEGCVTMANDHLLDLYQHIDIARTEVVLAHDVQWRNRTDLAIQQDKFRELFAQYRSAWLHNNFNDLAAIYTPDSLPSAIKSAGLGTTRRVSSNNTTHSKLLSPVGISLDALANTHAQDISLLLNPDTDQPNAKKHLVMSFELNDSSRTRVTFYWEQNRDGYWQIKREEINAGGA